MQDLENALWFTAPGDQENTMWFMASGGGRPADKTRSRTGVDRSDGRPTDLVKLHAYVLIDFFFSWRGENVKEDMQGTRYSCFSFWNAERVLFTFGDFHQPDLIVKKSDDDYQRVLTKIFFFLRTHNKEQTWVANVTYLVCLKQFVRRCT